ncbi:MAG: rhomboid family intramembrane serine protease, partial [Methanobacteriota archaeon]
LAALAIVVAGLGVILTTRLPRAYSLSLLIVVVFVVQYSERLFRPGPETVIAELGLHPAPFLAGNEPWTILTYMFLHSGFPHLFGNLFFLATVGPILEDRIGGWRFLSVYFAGGLAAAVATLALFPDVSTANVGASGAIFAILTTFAVLYPKETVPMPVFIVVWAPSMLVLFVYLGFNVAYVFADETHVAWWGHFAGAFAGLAIAFVLQRRARATGRNAVPSVDLAALRRLATTRELRDIVHRIEEMGKAPTKDDALLVEAWLDRFFARARCPTCSAPVARRPRGIVCEQGHPVE